MLYLPKPSKEFVNPVFERHSKLSMELDRLICESGIYDPEAIQNMLDNAENISIENIKKRIHSLNLISTTSLTIAIPFILYILTRQFGDYHYDFNKAENLYPSILSLGPLITVFLATRYQAGSIKELPELAHLKEQVSVVRKMIAKQNDPTKQSEYDDKSLPTPENQSTNPLEVIIAEIFTKNYEGLRAFIDGLNYTLFESEE